MADNTEYTEYKCPSCSAPLSFDPGSGKVACPNCKNTYDIETLHDFMNSDSAQGDNLHAAFDWSAYRTDKDETLEDTKVYTCKSCGAVIEAEETTAATTCPYCGNNVVLDDRVSGGLKPNAILPFKITPDKLPDALRAFYRKKRLLPRDFLQTNKTGEIQGMYVPFWLFDCGMEGETYFNAQKIRSYTLGNYDYTETRHYLLKREGEMHFHYVPEDASVKMPNDLMDSLEPYDFSELVDFDGAYLSGYIADRFDSDPDEELNRAGKRMMSSAYDVMKNTTVGYASVTPKSNTLKVSDPGVKYVLLPVYLLSCDYKGESYQYAVNGQTGKVVGHLPVSKAKLALYSWGTFLASFALIFLGIVKLLLS